MTDRHNVYVAGPYSADSRAEVVRNVHRAAEMACRVVARGHYVFCPHTMTDPMEHVCGRHMPEGFGYEDWLALDRSFLRGWATAILHYGASEGADRELGWAEELGLDIFHTIEEIPVVEAPWRRSEPSPVPTPTASP